VLAVVFWYPFDFRTDWGFVNGRLATLRRVPFEAYYWGTEFRAVTEVLHKAGFFFPLGAILAVGVLAIDRRVSRRFPMALVHASAVIAIATVAAGIEAIQLFLPGKFVDGTDWVLEFLGGLAGYACVWWFGPALVGRERSAYAGTSARGSPDAERDVSYDGPPVRSHGPRSAYSPDRRGQRTTRERYMRGRDRDE
jgi:hypothetical protein